MRKVSATLRFEKRLGQFITAHPDLEPAVQYAMQCIITDKKNGLRAHLLKGLLKGCRAARISYEYRVVFVLKKGTVTFIDIGTHDDVYR